MRGALRKILVRAVLSDTEARHLLNLVIASNLYDPYGVRRQLLEKLDYYAGDMSRPFGLSQEAPL